MSPNDPAGNDDVLVSSNELHLPLDRPVKVLLRSKDVLHDFAVPQFRVKMDLVPGMVTYVWFTPTRTGKFDILCMELCGIAHYTMRGYVVVDEQDDFDNWLAQQATWSDIQGMPAATPSRERQFTRLCLLPRATGRGHMAMNAPRLAGLPDWYIERQLNYYKRGIRGAHEDDVYGQQMAPMANMLADDTAIRNVTAYIDTLEPGRRSTLAAIRNGRVTLQHLRRLPWRPGTRQLCAAGTAPGGAGGLVPETPAGKLPSWHSRRPQAGHLRPPDGTDGPLTAERAIYRRFTGVPEHPVITGHRPSLSTGNEETACNTWQLLTRPMNCTTRRAS